MKRLIFFTLTLFLSVTTLIGQTINPPNLLTPSNGSTDNNVSIELDWVGAVGNSGYIYEVDITSSFNSSLKISGGYNSNISRFTFNDLEYGQLYYWRIATKYNYNADTTAWSNIWTFTTADQVTLVVPGNNTIGITPTFNLDWNPIIGSTNYLYEVDTATTFNSSELIKGLTNGIGSNVDVTNLKFNQQYYWRVAARHNSDTSNWSIIRSFTTISSPTLVTPSNNSINQDVEERIDWSFVAGNSGYIYEIDTTIGFNSSLLRTVSSFSNTSEAVVGNLRFGTRYYWRVAVKTATDTSDWSTVYSFTTKDQIGLVSPSNFSVNQDVTERLDWSFIAGNNGYIYEIDTTINFNSPLFLGSNSAFNTSEVMVSNLRFDTKYYWRVAAKTMSDTSQWSTVFNFTTSGAVNLTSPINNGVNQDISEVLDWSPILGNNGYIYEIDTVSSFNSPLLQQNSFTSNTSQVAVSNLRFGTKYYWRVAAKTVSDTSSWSVVFSFSTLDRVIPTAPTNGSVNQDLSEILNWLGVVGNNGYLYELDTVASFNSPDLLSASFTNNISQVLVSNLRFGTKYYWRVAAKSISDTTAWSTTYNFTTKDGVSLYTPPNNFIGTSIRPRLDWGNVTGSDNYIYQIDTTVNFNSPILINNTTANSISQVDIPVVIRYGTKYYWRVAARTTTDTSSWSPVFNFTTLNDVNLSFPVNNASNLTNTVNISWIARFYGTGYIYEADESPLFNGPNKITGSTSGSGGISSRRAVLSNLQYGQDYYWRVAAVSAIDTSGWSTSRKFSTAFLLSNAPTQISPTNGALNIQRRNLILDWTDDPNSTQYQFQLDTVNNFSSTSRTSTVISSLVNLSRRENFTTYYWRVRSKNNSGNSPWSPVWSFTTENCDNFDTLRITNCGSYLYRGTFYSTSGLYIRGFLNTAGCDSTVYLDLTINYPSSSNLILTACDSLVLNNQTFYSTGNYTQVITNSKGCDSTINLNLTVNNSVRVPINVVVCDSFVWAKNNQTYYSTGMYADTISTTSGCDSISILNLIITPTTNSILVQISCDSFAWRGTTLLQTGIYSDTIQNSANCDSIIILDLTIYPTQQSNQTLDVCTEYVWNGDTLRNTGIYRDTLSSINGCDSLLTLNLTVRDSTHNRIALSACDSIRVNGQLITQTAIYTQLLTNSVGCDSVLILDVTINNSTQTTFNITRCGSYFWPVTNRFYSMSGSYDTTFQAVNGCDSLVQLNLTVTTISNGISKLGLTLTASQTGALYQWLDCGNGNSVIAGETTQSYTPNISGLYAVEVSFQNCVDTSVCQSVILVGSEELMQTANEIVIYPNPSRSVFNIDFGTDNSSKQVEVFDINGKLIFQEMNIKNTVYHLEFNSSKGLYFIKLSGIEGVEVKRIMKE